MNDSELRAVALRHFYDRRHDVQMMQPKDFGKALPEISPHVLINVVGQLAARAMPGRISARVFIRTKTASTSADGRRIEIESEHRDDAA